MSRIIKKTIAMLIVLILLYANLAGTAFGIISYALEENMNVVDNSSQDVVDNSQSDIIEEEILKIETSEFFKNTMQELETEYEEKLNLKINEEKQFNQIEIYDVATQIKSGEEEIVDEQQENTNTVNIFYKSTKINKSELMSVIGDDGILEIKYTTLTEDTLPEEVVEQQTENQEPQKGIVTAENGVVEIGLATEADEEENITVIYPQNTISLEMKIQTQTQITSIEKLEIIHTRAIEIVENIEEVNLLETTKQIVVTGEEEILNKQESFSMPISYTKTVAELGIDKTQFSTSVENKINFTITMYTNELKYDLYKNPYFIIELPKEIKEVSIDNTIILNNKYFEVTLSQVGVLNENKVIAVRLEGEQTEYTKSTEENIQIAIETTIISEELIPTTESTVNLHYTNEIATTYDGIGNQDTGNSSVDISLVSNKDIIVETKAVLGETTYTSTKENYNTVTVEPDTYNVAQIIGTAINNTGETINAKILGSSTSIGQIEGIGNVYYTENENATIDIMDVQNKWQTEYTPNAKKYLIVLDNWEQGQTATFSYNMSLPESVEENTSHEVKFDVYNEEEIIETSKITINQIAKIVTEVATDEIKATIGIYGVEKLPMKFPATTEVTLENLTNEDIEGVTVDIIIPTNFRQISIDDSEYAVEIDTKNGIVHVKDITLEKNSSKTIRVQAVIEEYNNPIEQIKAVINYNTDKTIEISDQIEIQEPVTIETTISSNKEGKTLEANEEIEYTVTLKNIGTGSVVIYLSTPEIENLYIKRMEYINKTTGEEKAISGFNLSGEMSGISLNSQDEAELKIYCVTKELTSNSSQTMYVIVNGTEIYNTETDKLTNNINKKEETEEPSEPENPENPNTSNTIKGIAWLDKNENGIRENAEITLNNIQVILIDAQTSLEIANTVTNNNGEYEFNDLQSGRYLVIFRYNTNTFSITEYKNQETTEDLNSDIILTTQNGETVAKTEIVTLENNQTQKLDAGFILNAKFDMSINKAITKVTVNNNAGTKVYDFDSVNMAKIEIKDKNLKGSLIIIEYEIAITNTGELSGYIKQIIDTIPEGTTFSSELNQDWYYDEANGIIYSNSIANQELEPGETAIVKLVLTKEMQDDKIETIVNTTNIGETSNEYLVDDSESENNTSEASLIVSIQTGGVQSYIWLVITVITIIGTGIICAIKIVNKETIKDKQ